MKVCQFILKNNHLRTLNPAEIFDRRYEGLKPAKPERSPNLKNGYLKKRPGRFGTLKRHNSNDFYFSLIDFRIEVAADAVRPVGPLGRRLKWKFGRNFVWKTNGEVDDRSFVL
jgi:hypothetical protein